MTAHVAARPIKLRVAPASTAADWRAARTLVTQLVEWLGSTVGVDARCEQHDSEDELESLERFYREPNGRMLLGFLDGRPCATTGVHLVTSATAELRRVWVTPSARGHGLASRLLQSGIDAARDMGAESVWLETVSGYMDTAIGMYQRAGFRSIQPYSSLGATLPHALSLGLVVRSSPPGDGQLPGRPAQASQGRR